MKHQSVTGILFIYVPIPLGLQALQALQTQSKPTQKAHWKEAQLKE